MNILSEDKEANVLDQVDPGIFYSQNLWNKTVILHPFPSSL